MASLAWGALLLCMSLLAAPIAQADDAIDRELERVLRGRGASSVSVLGRFFLFEGQAQAMAQTTSARGCVGFVVIGTGEVRDVDVALHTVSGLPLDQDVSTASYAYVRACTDRDVPLVLSATLYAGRGELTILRVESAPRELGQLPASIPLAVMPGGRLEPAQAIGDIPEEGEVSAMLSGEEARLAERGYIAAGAPEVLDVQGGLTTTSASWLAGHCYRVVAHVPYLPGLTLEVDDGSNAPRLAREPNRDAVELAYCAQRSGAHRIRLRVRTNRGVAVLRTFEHPGAKLAASPAAKHPELALGAAEVAHQLVARGLISEHLGDAWVETGDPARFSAMLTAGECYAAAAVSARVSPVDLRLVGPKGHILSRTEGRNGVALAYACATETGSYQIVLTSRGREQRVAAWLGVPRPLPAGAAP